jgi:hypothetical protein
LLNNILIKLINKIDNLIKKFNVIKIMYRNKSNLLKISKIIILKNKINISKFIPKNINNIRINFN